MFPGRVFFLTLWGFGLLCGGALCDDWPQFRGPTSNSAVATSQAPATWSPDGIIAWKVDLPGRGPSSPIVVGNKVIVTASSGTRQDRLHVLAFDTQTGKQLW